MVGHLGGRGGGGEGDATTGFGRKASLHRMTAGERQGFPPTNHPGLIISNSLISNYKGIITTNEQPNRYRHLTSQHKSWVQRPSLPLRYTISPQRSTPHTPFTPFPPAAAAPSAPSAPGPAPRGPRRQAVQRYTPACTEGWRGSTAVHTWVRESEQYVMDGPHTAAAYGQYKSTPNMLRRENQGWGRGQGSAWQGDTRARRYSGEGGGGRTAVRQCPAVHTQTYLEQYGSDSPAEGGQPGGHALAVADTRRVPVPADGAP